MATAVSMYISNLRNEDMNRAGSPSESTRLVFDGQIAHGGDPNLRRSSSAFRSQTPDEMYFGTGSSISDKLSSAKQATHQSRMEVNRAITCPTCERLETHAN